jgi:hypothetical protein
VYKLLTYILTFHFCKALFWPVALLLKPQPLSDRITDRCLIFSFPCPANGFGLKSASPSTELYNHKNQDYEAQIQLFITIDSAKVQVHRKRRTQNQFGNFRILIKISTSICKPQFLAIQIAFL